MKAKKNKTDIVINEYFDNKEKAEARAEYLRIGTFKNSYVQPLESGRFLVVKKK